MLDHSRQKLAGFGGQLGVTGCGSGLLETQLGVTNLFDSWLDTFRLNQDS